MPEVSSLDLPVVSADGAIVCTLKLRTLPRLPGRLWDERAVPDRDQTLEPVQVAEGYEYRYELVFVGLAPASVTTNRPELFLADSVDGLTGRLRPSLSTGLLPLTISSSGMPLGSCCLEVRSTKLDYLGDYRWMMRDISSTVSELAMDRFAPTEQRFSPDAQRDPATLYQQFAFLRHALTDAQFLAAIRHVLSRPYLSWDEEPEARRPGQGWSGGSREIRQLAMPGRRVPVANTESLLASVGVPAFLMAQRPQPTVDNDANRFVRFALTRWLELTDLVSERLASVATPSGARSRQEVLELRTLLQSLLAEGVLRDVGELSHFPSGSQVLQKREGYRDIFRLYALCEVASHLAWSGGEDVYGAGQRDVATLYEYWVFLKLAQVVADMCGSTFDWSSLFTSTSDGMGLDLKRGKAARVTGTIERHGRRLGLALFFNRTFSRSSGSDPSWTRPMRPDCSLKIEWLESSSSKPDPIWVHFDAKYRVDSITDIMPTPTDEESANALADLEDEEERRGQAKRDDLLKMHAYRDAIRRSAGAYVIYPGTVRGLYPEYQELLPGLGAFPLRPLEAGGAAGDSAIRQFISDVLDHSAVQATQHERGRFWERSSYSAVAVRSRARAAFSPFLTKPPADTIVLLGFVRDDAHFAWIERHKRYNLRADDRTGAVGLSSQSMAAEFALLYSRTRDQAALWRIAGVPEVWTKLQMSSSGYPHPRGQVYLCLPLGDQFTAERGSPMTSEHVLRVRSTAAPTADWGAPICLTWHALTTMS